MPKVVVVDLLAAFSFKAKAVLVAVSLASTSACTAAIAFEAAIAFAVTVAWSALFALFTVVIFVSTYVFTAFWVGNNTSLLPRVVTADLFAVFSLIANPGTVGAAAVPDKSPANWIFPLVVEVASGIVAAATCVST